MKYLIILFFSWMPLYISADPIDVDVVINGQSINTEYSAKKLLQEYVDEATWECLSLHMVESVEAGTSPYVLEIWEEPEFLRNYVFKETRKKTEKNKKGEEVEKKYTVAGVNVRTKIQYYGRLSEREKHAILEIFRVDGDIDKEIPDEDVKAKYKPKWIDNRELNDAMIEKHADKIASLREETTSNLKATLGTALMGCLVKRLLGPVRITDAVEKSKDKMKKMAYSKCAETPLRGDGSFSFTCYSEEELNGVKYLIDQGGVYPAEKDNQKVLNVRGGKKEIFKAHAAGSPLYMGYKNYMMDVDLSKNKLSPMNVSFLFLYETILPYSDLDKTKFELQFQSRYLGNRNINVLTKDPLLDKEKGEDFDMADIKGRKSITVMIGEMKKGLYNSKTDPIKTATVKVSVPSADGTVSSDSEISGWKDSKEVWQTDYKNFKMEEVDNVMLVNDIEIIGIIEQKKDEVKKVLIRTTLPVDKGELKVYDRQKITKKTKEIAKLKVKDITGRFTAIAEVSDGKKELLPLLTSEKELTLKYKGPGMFSLSRSEGFKNFGGVFRYKLEGK